MSSEGNVASGEGTADGSLRPVLNAVGGTLTGAELRLVERAYLVAAYWHRGRRRCSGDPYITHPVAVAAILAELGMGHDLLCAALLHDVLHDVLPGTGCPEAELVREFGEPIAGLVRELDPLDDQSSRPQDWVATTDTRVLTIRLAHRLHNQRTMRFLAEEKQRSKSRQTLELYAPVAGMIGLRQIQEELEGLATATLAGSVAGTAGSAAGSAAGSPAGNAARSDGVRASFRLIAVGAIMLPAGVRARWLEEWLGELHEAAGRKARLRFAAQVIRNMPPLAVTLRSRGSGYQPRWLAGARVAGARCLRWVLASDLRVWSGLAPLLAWLVLNTSGGLGDALAILITMPPVLAAGVHTLRARLGIKAGHTGKVGREGKAARGVKGGCEGEAGGGGEGGRG
ncbi:HD domain-containing protein [Nonomuraea sp. NPDC002799]